MKKVILIVFMILSIDLYSQKINLTSLAGVWRWQDSATDSEFVISVKKINFNWPQILGGQLDSAIVGGYKYKKNGVVLVDKLSEVSENKLDPIKYSIWIGDGLGLGIRDYLTQNGRGEFKYIGPSSRVEIISLDIPKQIRWILNDISEQVVVTFDDEDGDKYFFPDGTALPTDIVLTKIE